MLDKLKLLLGISSSDTSKDDLLNLILSQCTSDALTFTHLNDAEELEGIILQMSVYRYNQIGAEGLNKESYSGVSYDYNTDYPEPIKYSLRAFRKIRTV